MRMKTSRTTFFVLKKEAQQGKVNTFKSTSRKRRKTN